MIVFVEFGIFLFGIYDIRYSEYKTETENSSAQVHFVDRNGKHRYDVRWIDQRLHCEKQPGELGKYKNTTGVLVFNSCHSVE